MRSSLQGNILERASVARQASQFLYHRPLIHNKESPKIPGRFTLHSCNIRAIGIHSLNLGGKHSEF